MLLNGKVVRYDQLITELATAGITVTALGQDGDDLHSYTAQGAYQDLPSGAATVIANHVPQPTDDQNDHTAEQTWLSNIASDQTALTNDATALRDTTQTLTTAQLRAMLARADDAIVRLDRGLIVLTRRMARRGY